MAMRLRIAQNKNSKKKLHFENYKNLLFKKVTKSVAVTDRTVFAEVGTFGGADWLDLNAS